MRFEVFYIGRSAGVGFNLDLMADMQLCRLSLYYIFFTSIFTNSLINKDNTLPSKQKKGQYPLQPACHIRCYLCVAIRWINKLWPMYMP